MKESAFLQAGRARVKKTLNTKAYSVSRSDSKTRGVFFFFTVLHHLPTTHKHGNTHTSTHAQFVVIEQLWRYIRVSSDCVVSIIWPCIYTLIQLFCLFSVSLMPVPAAGHGRSAAPTEGGLIGLLLLKPLILGAVMVCWSVGLSLLILISVWLNQLGHM